MRQAKLPLYEGRTSFRTYHVTYTGGLRFRRYVRGDDVKEFSDACKAHQALRAEFRAARAEYRLTLVRVRHLAKMFRGE
jgi:hypothetical protein